MVIWLKCFRGEVSPTCCHQITGRTAEVRQGRGEHYLWRGSRGDLEEKMLLPAQRTLDVSVRPVSLWLYRWGLSLDLPADPITPLRRLYLPTGVHSRCYGLGPMLLASCWGRVGEDLL